MHTKCMAPSTEYLAAGASALAKNRVYCLDDISPEAAANSRCLILREFHVVRWVSENHVGMVATHESAQIRILPSIAADEAVIPEMPQITSAADRFAANRRNFLAGVPFWVDEVAKEGVDFGCLETSNLKVQASISQQG